MKRLPVSLFSALPWLFSLLQGQVEFEPISEENAEEYVNYVVDEFAGFEMKFSEVPGQMREEVLRNGPLVYPILERMVRQVQGVSRASAILSLIGELELDDGGTRLDLIREIVRGDLALPDEVPPRILPGAIDRLGRLGSAADLDLLIPHLSSRDHEMRSAVIRAIGKLALPSDIPRIESAWQSAPPIWVNPEKYTAEEIEEFKEYLPKLEEELEAEKEAAIAQIKARHQGSQDVDSEGPMERVEVGSEPSERSSAFGWILAAILALFAGFGTLRYIRRDGG